jgi:hypothetical protein
VYKYHVFLIHSLVVGYLGCFHSLAIVNSVAINRVCRCLWNNLSHIVSGISLGLVLLGYVADLYLVFKEAYILFSKVVVLAYIPTNRL